jgi:5-methylcytosine-specific restriction protein A
MNCNIDELRKIALLRSSRSAPPRERKSIYRARSAAIKFYVIARSEGLCEGCGEPAPFVTDKHKPYLEPHHTLRVADDGPDHPKNVIALCPNCHRRAHHAKDAEAFNDRLKRKLSRIER